MPATTQEPDRITKAIDALRKQGATERDIETYLVEHEGLKPKSANLPDHDPPPIEPTYAQQALGGIASLARDIPGAEAAQAGVRALVRRQPYREALSDIRGAEDSAPGVVRNANRFIGGGIASAVLPGGAAAKGAQYGALTGALSSDPNSGVESRAIGAGAGAVTGALAGHYLGKAGDKLAPSAGRARDAIVTRLGLRNAVRPAVRLTEAQPKAEGLMALEDAIRSEPTTLSPRVVQSLEDRIAQMAEPAESPSTLEGFLGNTMGNLEHAGSSGGIGPARPDPLYQQLEEIIAQAEKKPFKQRGITKAQQEWRQQRFGLKPK